MVDASIQKLNVSVHFVKYASYSILGTCTLLVVYIHMCVYISS